MALNKRKILDAARKFAQKGAQEKALTEYAKLLKADSRDAKLLLEVGDAHRRWGQNEEAVSHYIRVAEQYKQGGFDARAVAVFKQILNLDGKRYPAYVSLAELYQRMGLDGEAVNALQTAADGYHKEGQKHEALELLRKMATLDPSNTASRMKVAELLRQEELLDEAVAEFEAVAEEMLRQGETDALISVYERILEIRPERADVEFTLARNLVQLSQSDRAEAHARRAFDQKPDAEGHFDLLIDIYTAAGKTDELTDVTKTLAQRYRDRGDEDQARELMQRLPNDGSFGLSEDPVGLNSSQDSSDDDDDLLDDHFLDEDFLSSENEIDDDENSFIELSDDADLDLDDESLGDDRPGSDPEPNADPNGSSASDARPPEGDPDQLFAEASVYLRYGKRDQAIASLEAILLQEPNHRDALEKIGEFHADAGDGSKAVEYWLKTAALAREAGDDVSVDNLRERIAVLDPAAAEGLALAPPAFSPSQEGAVASDSEADEDFAFDLDMDLGESSVSVANTSMSLSQSLSNPGTATGTQSQKISEGLEEAEFYMEQELYDEAEAVYNRVLELAPNHPSAMLRLGELLALRGEDPDASAVAAAPLREGTLDPAGLPFDESEAESEGDADDVSVDLAENSELDIAVETDIETDLKDDAEEDAEEDSEEAAEPDAAVEADADVAEVEVEADEELEEDVEFDVEVDVDVELDVEESVIDHASAADSDAPDNIRAECEAELGLSDIDTDSAKDRDSESDDDKTADDLGEGADGKRALETSISDSTIPLPAYAKGTVDDEREGDVDSDDDVDTSTDTGADGVASTQSERDSSPAVAQVDADDSFDLAAELRESLEEEDEQAEQADRSVSDSPTSEDEGFASIFKDFKSGVEKTLAGDDYDTRFDLGIAYRGMELFDDALGEFRICLDSPGHRLESLHMMGLCAIDVGRFNDATNHLEQALSSDDVPEQKEAGLRFDLARSFEGLGDHGRAKESFEAAKAADATIPGIDDCIARAARQIENSDGSIELEDANDDADAGGLSRSDASLTEGELDDGSEEAFESFDDLVAEVEASARDSERSDDRSSAGKSEQENESRADGVAEPDSESAAPKGGTKKRKKKRISFV